MSHTNSQVGGASVLAPVPHEYEDILSPEAVSFLVSLHKKFNDRRLDLLRRRIERQERIDAGELPDFLPETESIRKSDWRVAPIPHDLVDRRVEITGPVDRKMVINALNSGANVFMADFEDSNSPTWLNNLAGQTECSGCRPRRHHLRQSGRETVRANCKARCSVCAPARLAFGREAFHGGRRAHIRIAIRFRPVLFPQRKGAHRKRIRAIFLPS